MKTPAESFVTTVDLSIKSDRNISQFVYASQLYGTLFGIYANFECIYEQEKPIKIKSIRFKLINYKGYVNIGLIYVKDYFDKELDDEVYKAVEKEIDKEVIYLYVQPLKSSSEHVNFEFTNGGLDLRVKNQIIFERIVKPLNDRIKGENELGNSQKEIFFDQEFNYRDGYYETYNKPRPGHIDFPKPIASVRCHQSNVMLKY